MTNGYSRAPLESKIIIILLLIKHNNIQEQVRQMGEAALVIARSRRLRVNFIQFEPYEYDRKNL